MYARQSECKRAITLQHVCVNNSGRKQALSTERVKCKKLEKTSRKKQLVRAAAAEGGSIVRDGERRMPRDESIGTHDRANGMSDYANRSVRARTSTHLVAE